MRVLRHGTRLLPPAQALPYGDGRMVCSSMGGSERAVVPHYSFVWTGYNAICCLPCVVHLLLFASISPLESEPYVPYLALSLLPLLAARCAAAAALITSVTQLECKRAEHAEQLTHIEERMQAVVNKKDTTIAALRAELQVSLQQGVLAGGGQLSGGARTIII